MASLATPILVHSSQFSVNSLASGVNREQKSTSAIDSNPGTRSLEIGAIIQHSLDCGLQIIDEDAFQRIRFLGSGGTMSVYEGWWKERSQAVALKYVNASPPMEASSISNNESELQQILQSAGLEISVLVHEGMRRHPNIVEILAVSWQQVKARDNFIEIYPVLVMELACPSHPTLDKLISAGISLSLKLELLRDVLEGLSAVHDLKIVHGDIKPENVLIFNSTKGRPTAKLSDFGLSQANPDLEAGGTEYWNAPECLKGASEHHRMFAKSPKRDFYSYGLLVCYALLEELPFAQRGWALPEISRMKVEDKVGPELVSRWRLADENVDEMTISELDLKEIGTEVSQMNKMVWELIPDMLNAEPEARATAKSSKSAFYPHTASRSAEEKVLKAAVSDNLLPAVSNVLERRFMAPESPCSPSIPQSLRVALFKHYLSEAKHQIKTRRSHAMLQIGLFKTYAFGTRYDITEAVDWFSRAASEGSHKAKIWVFRLERQLKQSVLSLVPGLTTKTRATWIVECLLREFAACFRSYIPSDLQVDKLQDQLKNTLLELAPELIESGLRRAVDEDIIKTLGIKQTDIANDLFWTNYPSLRQAIQEDDDSLLHRALMIDKHSISADLREKLVVAATEQRSMSILRELICQPTFSLGFEIALVKSLRKSDTGMARFLLDLGTPGTSILSGRDLHEVICGCANDAVALALGVLDRVRFNLNDPLLCPSYSDSLLLRRQALDGIYMLMAINPDINSTLDNFHPPLFVGIGRNQYYTVRLILALGGNPNVRYMGMTALHLAVKMLRPLMVATLLAFGADPNARDFKSQYETPLHQISSGFLVPPYYVDDTYMELLDYFGDPFTPAPHDSDEHNSHRRLIMHLLLAYGADVGALELNGFTPFMSAIASRGEGFSALHVAIEVGNLQMLRYIIRSSDKSSLNGSKASISPLNLAAASDKKASSLETLLEAGADPTVTSRGGKGPLMTAVRHSQKISFSILLRHIKMLPIRSQIAAISATDICGRSAAHIALNCEDPSMTTYFLEAIIPHMSDIDQRDVTGYNLLHWTVIKKNLTAMKLLLHNGADINSRGYKGMTSLHLAYSLEASEFIEFLHSLEANAAVLDDSGLNPFQFSLFAKQNPDVMKKMRIEARQLEDVATRAQEKESQATTAEREERQEQLRKGSEYIPGDRFTRDSPESITEIEASHLRVVEISIQTHGEKHQGTLQKLNNLGCVYERYGRLKKAEDVYRQGWRASVGIFGNHHRLSQDFANKIMRVLVDTGRQGEANDVAQWISDFGQETLRQTFLEIHAKNDPGKWKTVPRPIVSTDILCLKCDASKCQNLGDLKCPRCKVHQYCSESCRVLDLKDDKSTHRECILSLPPEEHPSIAIEGLHGTDPFTTEIARIIIERLTRGFDRTDFVDFPPQVTAAHMVYYNPRNFDTPLRLQTERDMAVFFMPGEYRFRFKWPGNDHWHSPENMRMVQLYKEMDFWIAPLPKSHSNSSDPIAETDEDDGRSLGTQLLVMAKLINVDFTEPRRRRAERLNLPSWIC
ncbi:uncharacterized protein PAC_14624 [Phialocephala subalpina]|uniref:Protein kinase domain-containing protein n=1 Tax=Phialocephala subalpina TaxID=576137 RepID=A0A1L7XI58_9HELO|nr:uncharacterized protein PAC_14624 [Phialocephala subalpina]